MDSDDRSGRLLASCWSLVGASAVFLSLRIYCKLWRGKGLWWDDHTMIISWFSLTVAVSLLSYIVTLGFGKHQSTIDHEDLKIININTILVAAFGIISTCVSKTSFALTLYRIIINKWMRWFLLFVIITINVSMNLVWIFGFAKCTPVERVWDSTVEGKCWDKQALLKYQLFAAYYSSILDFVLAFLPWKILMAMSMLLREKIGVAVAMSLGAIAGICGIVKAVMVVSMTSTDITYDRVDLTIWTLTEPAVTIMAACIPVLRMLYRELKSSHRSYMQQRSTGNRYHQGTESTNIDKTKRSTKYRHDGYGRNSVLIMSTNGWQESQEALQDTPSSHTDRPPKTAGIVKTAEVNVTSHRVSKMTDGDSFELASMESAYTKTSGRHAEVPEAGFYTAQ